MLLCCVDSEVEVGPKGMLATTQQRSQRLLPRGLGTWRMCREASPKNRGELETVLSYPLYHFLFKVQVFF